MTTYTEDDFKRAEFATRDASYSARHAMRCNEDSPTPWQGQHGAWRDDQMADAGWVPVPAGSYTRTDDDGLTLRMVQQQRDQATARAERAERDAEVNQVSMMGWAKTSESWQETAEEWESRALKAEQERDHLATVLATTARQRDEVDKRSAHPLTAPARDPRAEEIQADLATAEEPEMDDEDRRLIADHLAALGYRKTGAES